MKQTTAEKWAKLLFLFITIATAFQGFIPTIPEINEPTLKLVSAITLFLVSALTIIRTTLSEQINNAANKGVWILALVAIGGGVLDLFTEIDLNNSASQWIRFGITFLTFVLGLIAKLRYSTDQTGNQII